MIMNMHEKIQAAKERFESAYAAHDAAREALYAAGFIER